MMRISLPFIHPTLLIIELKLCTCKVQSSELVHVPSFLEVHFVSSKNMLLSNACDVLLIRNLGADHEGNHEQSNLAFGDSTNFKRV